MICSCCGREDPYENRDEAIRKHIIEWFQTRKDEKQKTKAYKKWENKKEVFDKSLQFPNKERLIGPAPEKEEQKTFTKRDVYRNKNEGLKTMKVDMLSISEWVDELFREEIIGNVDGKRYFYKEQKYDAR